MGSFAAWTKQLKTEMYFPEHSRGWGASSVEQPSFSHQVIMQRSQELRPAFPLRLPPSQREHGAGSISSLAGSRESADLVSSRDSLGWTTFTPGSRQKFRVGAAPSRSARKIPLCKAQAPLESKSTQTGNHQGSRFNLVPSF